MNTALDLIRTSMLSCGILALSQTLYAEDVYLAFDLLNAMLAEWNRKRWLVYHLVDVAKVANGQQGYSIGPGQDFDVARPDSIAAAYVRLLGNQTGTVDFPMDVLTSREDYSAITLKQLQSIPVAVWYDADYPTGTIYPYPVPTAGQYEVHLIVKETLTQFTNLSTAISLPPVYQDALIYSLGARLRPVYRLPPDPTVTALAVTGLNTVRGSNAQVPRLAIPSAFAAGGAGRWPYHGVIPNPGL